jgi:hypothetical protein
MNCGTKKQTHSNPNYWDRDRPGRMYFQMRARRPRSQNHSWQKKAKNGAVWDTFGVFWDKFGVIWAQFGVVWDKVGNEKTPENRIFNPKNQENTKFPRLSWVKTVGGG